MQFLYRIELIRPEILSDGPTEEEARILADHAAYIEALTAEAKVLMAGRTQNSDASAFGIVILSVESEAEAVSIMEADPAVRFEVMRSALFPYKIAYLTEAIGDKLAD